MGATGNCNNNSLANPIMTTIPRPLLLLAQQAISGEHAESVFNLLPNRQHEKIGHLPYAVLAFVWSIEGKKGLARENKGARGTSRLSRRNKLDGGPRADGRGLGIETTMRRASL